MEQVLQLIEEHDEEGEVTLRRYVAQWPSIPDCMVYRIKVHQVVIGKLGALELPRRESAEALPGAARPTTAGRREPRASEP